MPELLQKHWASKWKRSKTGNLVAAKGIYSAAALPVFDLFHFEAQCFCRSSGIFIQIFCFILQGKVQMRMNNEEVALLKKSAEALKEVIAQIEL